MITLPRSEDSSVLPAGPIPEAAPSSAYGGASAGSFAAFPQSGASVPYPGPATVSPLKNAGQWASLQHQQLMFPAASSQSAGQQFPQSVGGAVNSQVWLMELSCQMYCLFISDVVFFSPFPKNILQPWHVPFVSTGQGHPSTPMPHAYHHASKPANEAINSAVSQPSAVEVKPSGRSELPEVIGTFILLQNLCILCTLACVYCLSYSLL